MALMLVRCEYAEISIGIHLHSWHLHHFALILWNSLRFDGSRYLESARPGLTEIQGSNFVVCPKEVKHLHWRPSCVLWRASPLYRAHLL